MQKRKHPNTNTTNFIPYVCVKKYIEYNIESIHIKLLQKKTKSELYLAPIPTPLSSLVPNCNILNSICHPVKLSMMIHTRNISHKPTDNPDNIKYVTTDSSPAQNVESDNVT